jgi:hypothetical protein
VAIDLRRLPGTLRLRGTNGVRVNDVVDDVQLAPPSAPPLPPVEGRPHFVRLRAWVATHRTSLLILAVLLTFVGVVQAWGMTHSPQPLDDEGTYVTWAYSVQKWHRLTHYTYTYEHPPIGWLLLAVWTWTTAAFDRASAAILAGREFMVVCQLASCALMYVLARRLRFNRVFATVAVLLFAFAPLALKYHRFVYLDNIATPWILASLVLALSPRRHVAAAIGSGVCFAIALLIKETSLLFLPALVYQAWQHADARTRRLTLWLGATVLVMVVALYGAYALLKGELFPGRGHTSLLQTTWWNVFGRQVSGTALREGTANHAQVVEWLHDDSVLLLYGMLVLPTAFFVRTLRPLAVSLVVVLLMAVRSYYLPIPFIIIPLSIIPILIAGVANQAWNGVRGAWRQGTTQGSPLIARGAKLFAAAVGVTALLGAGTSVAVNWVKNDGVMLRDRHADHFFAAERWVEKNVPRNTKIVTEDIYWTDLVRAGWQRNDVIWHEKIDSDPEVEHRLPHGWQSLDYVISSSGMRARMNGVPLPTVQAAVANSTVVASFGLGGDAVEIRRVNH